MNISRIAVLLALLLGVVFVIAGCGGGGGGGANGTFTAEETRQIQQLDQAVEAAMNGSSNDEMIAKMAAAARAIPGFASVKTGSYGIAVTMTNGVTTIWDFSALDKREIRSPRLQLPVRSSRGPTVGTLLYLSPLNDDSHSGIPDYADDYKTLASSANLEYSEVDGSSVSVDALKHLPSADIIVFNTHGGNYDGAVVLATGEDPSAGASDNRYYRDLTGAHPRLVRLHHSWDNKKTGAFRYCITPQFIDFYYSSQKLKQHSLVYTGACFGAANNSMGDAFRRAGASAFLGWSDEGVYGAQYGARFLSYLLNGNTLRQAYNSAKDEGITDYTFGNTETWWNPLDSYHPELRVVRDEDSDAWGWKLPVASSATAPSITITAPSDGSSQTSPVVHLVGTVSDTSLDRGTVTILNNGRYVSAPLPFTNGTFDARQPISPGQNQITVSAINEGGVGNASVNVECDAVSQVLWTELVWDTNGTDVDLHLLRPGAELFEFPGDCYFSNETPDWGAYGAGDDPQLDIDNTWGYGPEHITLNQVPTAGRYSLWVHYWEGDVTTNFTLVVATVSGLRTFGPFELNYSGHRDGEAIHVCDIDLPSGNIIVDNTRSSHSMRIKVPAGIKKMAIGHSPVDKP